MVDEHDVLVGVAVVGRPVARLLDDGLTLEVTRVATDGTPSSGVDPVRRRVAGG